MTQDLSDLKLTKAQRAFLSHYRDFIQNGRRFPQNSVWTRRKGTTFPGLVACQEAGLVVSEPDDRLNPDGWRHDITPAGRVALQALGGSDEQAE